VRWADVPGETGYTVQRSTTAAFTTVAQSVDLAADVTSYTTGNVARQTWFFRVRAANALGVSAWSAPVSVPAAP
jgi:hypothetical protein